MHTTIYIVIQNVVGAVYLLLIPILDREEDTLNLALVQYVFTHGDHEIEVAPHGNAKRAEPYVRTMSSVMQKLKSVATKKKPKQALAVVSNESGGVVSVPSAGALP